MSELHRHFIRKVRDDGMTNAIIAGVGFIIIKIRLLFQRLSSGGPEIIKEIEGSQMKLDVRLTSPNKLERHLALKGIREPQTTKKYREILERTKERGGTIHIFDIGANVGYYALLGAHILDKEGKIYAIEAEPNNADRLRQNIELNDYSQIKVFQVAAGEERSTQNLNVREKSNIHKMGELTSKKRKEIQ